MFAGVLRLEERAGFPDFHAGDNGTQQSVLLRGGEGIQPGGQEAMNLGDSLPD